MKQTVFDYFYGQEAESFSFYRIPKVLFTDERFAGLTCEAKVLYGLMLDRMSLSVRNGWLDDDGKVFIIFRIDDICELIGCASQKAVKLVHELDDVKGIGLIEKHRGGLGDANVFYIKNFMMPLEISDENSSVSGKEAENGADSQNCENHKTGIVKSTNQQFRKSQSNNTDNNQTERSDTESIYLSGGESVPYEVPAPEMIDVMEGCRGFVRKNIEYDCYLGESRSELEAVDELVELIAEVLAMPDTGTIRINGNDMPAVLVKKQYYKLRHDHIDYVRWTMKHNTTKVANIRAYLVTALYNSIITIGHYYESEANYDMSGRSDE